MQEENYQTRDFSERLRIAMKEKNLKQTQLSSLSGLSTVAISNYVSGDRRPTADALYRMSVILGVSMEWLIGGEEYKSEILNWKNKAEAAEKELEEVKKALKTILKLVG